MEQQVVRGWRPGASIGVGAGVETEASHLSSQAQGRSQARAGYHLVSPRVLPGMLRAESSIYASKDNGHRAKLCPYVADRLYHTRIPVGHARSDHHQVRAQRGCQGCIETIQGQAKASVMARDGRHRFRLVDDGLEELARAIGTGLGRAREGREAVDEGDAVAIVAQGSGNSQKPQWLDPEVVGCKVIDPGIDEENLALDVHGGIIAPGGPYDKPAIMDFYSCPAERDKLGNRKKLTGAVVPEAWDMRVYML